MDLIKDLLPSILSNLKTPDKTKRQKLCNAWSSIIGEKFYPLTKPSLTADGKLFIWVKESTLAFELNLKYRQTILKRAQAILGDDEIKGIYFRVGQLR